MCFGIKRRHGGRVGNLSAAARMRNETNIVKHRANKRANGGGEAAEAERGGPMSLASVAGTRGGVGALMARHKAGGGDALRRRAARIGVLHLERSLMACCMLQAGGLRGLHLASIKASLQHTLRERVRCPWRAVTGCGENEVFRADGLCRRGIYGSACWRESRPWPPGENVVSTAAP